MLNVERLLADIQKLNRLKSLHTLVAAIQARSFTHAERVRFLGRIMSELLARRITPREGKMLTNLVTDQKKGR